MGTDVRILVARPDHVGDVLLTLPALGALRRSLPDAEIVCLVSPSAGEVTEHCPAADRTIPVSFPPLDEPFDADRWSATVRPIAAALRGQFDMALLPRPHDPWSGVLVAGAEIPVRFGFSHPGTRDYLTDALPLPARRHVSNIATDLVAAAVARDGVCIDQAALRMDDLFVPSAADQADAGRLLERFRYTTGARPFVLHPAAGWELKSWPAERWVGLVSALHDRYRVKPMVLGTGRDGPLVEEIAERSGHRAVGLAGVLSLGGLAALHRQARLVLGVDSGALHLAALMGAPVVSLFGPADPIEFGLLSAPVLQGLLQAQLPCVPCRTLFEPPCGALTEPQCLQAITVPQVLEAVRSLLARVAGPVGTYIAPLGRGPAQNRF